MTKAALNVVLERLRHAVACAAPDAAAWAEVCAVLGAFQSTVEAGDATSDELAVAQAYAWSTSARGRRGCGHTRSRATLGPSRLRGRRWWVVWSAV